MPHLHLLKARFEGLGITCLDELPKNHKVHFKLRIIPLDKKKTFVDDDNAFDVPKSRFPDTIETAKEAWLGYREDNDSYYISVYTKH